MNSRAWRVFLSYSSRDEERVTSFAESLRAVGLEVWLDKWSILPGESITKEIELGLEECDFFLLMLSANALASGWVDREWRAKYHIEVQQDEVKLIVVRLDGCALPLFLKEKRYVDLFAIPEELLAAQLKEDFTKLRDRKEQDDFDNLMNSIKESIKDGTATTKYNLSHSQINKHLRSKLNSVSAKAVDVEVFKALVAAEMASLRLSIDENHTALIEAIRQQEHKRITTGGDKSTEIFHSWLMMSLKKLESERLYVLRLGKKVEVGLPNLISTTQIVVFIEHSLEDDEDVA